VDYRESPRSRISSLALVALMGAGFTIDALLGHAVDHVWGWLGALALLLAVDALAIHAANSTRSITLDASTLTVGEDTLARADIVAVPETVDPSWPVMGMRLVNTLPRGVAGLALRLSDGSGAVVPTKRPERLAAALKLGVEVPTVRPADEADLPLLHEIGDRADAVFRVAGYALPAVNLPARPTVAVFVVGSPPVGFVQVGEADGNAHIDEVSVLPGQMRRGIGTQLVLAACGWAATNGYEAVTLTTFADVPWNGPFYARLGFVEIDDIGPDVAERREAERAAGLDEVGRRIVMRREL
jgi:GNAT superfamily N-acetyltransferase